MANRLARESSPYLRQHAENPVDWYPWGDEALARAKAEDKPILLSVGYSACHWCHVMEHESFSDPDVAALMNRDFVNVKVDREERPDLDAVYMQAVQAFTGGHGGWPMTVFLTPDGKPFVGGTYFPPEPRHGMPSFRQVLARAADLYRNRKDDVAAVTQQVVDLLEDAEALPAGADRLRDDWLDVVAEAADRAYDARNGGFGGAPKFPPHGLLQALLAHHHRTGRQRSLDMVTGTIDAMIRGGMYDHLGGGFARYAVDAEWRIPHFEKMLYDNAQLVPVLLDAFRITGRATYARIAQETLDFVARELTSPEGVFYSAFDADSEGEEGKYYVWTPRELRDVLGIVDGTRVATLLEVHDDGSFEHGTSVLRLERPLEDLDPADRALLERAFPALLAVRSKRVPPSRDDKAITAWNGLMITAFAKGAQVLGVARYEAIATGAARFLLDHVRVNGRLMRSWKDGVAKVPAFLDDHACLLQGLVDVYETTLELEWLREADALAVEMLALFGDDGGGLWYTGMDAEPLVVRTRKLIGGAEPSGAAVAAQALLRLETLSGRADLGDRAERALRAAQDLLDRAPRALGLEAVAAAWRTGATQELGLVGRRDDPALQSMLAELRRRYLPISVVGRIDPGTEPPELPWMEGRDVIDGKAAAYLCEGRACRLPTTEPSELAGQLDEAMRPRRRARIGGARVRAPELPADPAAWIGSPLTLADLRGRVAVLDFWALCCINCQHVLPELAAVEERFADAPVTVIGVHSAKFPMEQEREAVERAVARHRVAHPVVNDPDHDLWDRYAVRAWPTIVVLDPQGRVAWTKSGEVSRDELGDVIERLLDEGREAGTLGSGGAARVAADAATGALSFPGKVHVWPDALAQAQGADPFGPDARLYVADSGHDVVIEARLVRGDDGWPRAEGLRRFVGFHDPQGLSRAGDRLWVADTGHHQVRVVDLRDGSVSVAAGTGQLGRGGAIDPEAPLQTDLRSPWDVAATEDAVFVAMAGTHQLWVLLPEQAQLGPFAGSGAEAHVDGSPERAALAQPSGLALFGRFLFWADSETSSVRVMDLADRHVRTVVGKGLFDFGDVDGAADEVLLQHPLGVAFAGDTLYVADTFNHKIKAIDLDQGQTTTLATGLCEPGGLAVAGDFLVVADTGNHRIVAVRRDTGEIRPVSLSVPTAP